MANTYVDYTAVAAQTDYNFSFEYLRDEHVKVKVNGVETSDFTIVTSPTPTKIRFTVAPTAGAAIKIYRDSRGDFSPLVDFVDGSILTENELDEGYKHNLFLSQEASEGTGGEQLTKKGLTHYDAENNKIINLFAPSDSTDAANKAYVDDTIDTAIALGGSPAIVSLGGYDVTATGSTAARSLADRFADVVNVKDYSSVQAALDSGNKNIYIPAGTYVEDDITVTADDLHIFGEGNIQYTTKGLTITGSNNIVDGLTFSRTSKSTSTSMNYTNYGVALLGSHNTVVNVESYNCEGSGIVLDGNYYLTIDKCHVHDNITGIRLTAKCRNVKITNCNIRENNVNNDSGADGILCTRNVTGLIVENCDIYDSGEHGIYFQGQQGIFVNNRVRNNHADGIKFGSYDTDLYEYPSETLDRWVDSTGYGVRHVVISNNYIADNGGTDGIFFQPSAKDVVISNNVLLNNQIRCVYFNYTGGDVRLEDILNISVEGNRVSGTDANIDVACYEGLKVTNNYVDGYIRTYAPNSATTPRLSSFNQKPEIQSNNSNYIDLQRSTGASVKDNTTVDFNVGSNSNSANIINNVITGLDASLDTARVRLFDGNEVTVVGDIAFNSSSIDFSFPFQFTGNTIIGNSYTSNYFISASFNADDPDYGRFSNNYIECTSCNRPVELEGTYCSMTGNTILGSASSDNAIDIYGDQMVVTGNVLRYGDIKLRNDTANIVTSNKCSSVINTGFTTNIVANNG